MSVKGTRLTIGKASLAVGAGLLGLSLMSVMTADDGPPDAVLAEMQSTTKELAEKVGGACWTSVIGLFLTFVELFGSRTCMSELAYTAVCSLFEQ